MEQQITFISRGHTVRGWAHVPDGGAPSPAVVMAHGFTGNCSEHGLFDDFANQANQAGIYVLRIDCVGSGASEGDFAEDTCLGGWREDVLQAVRFLEKQPEVDASRMATMGISMGAGAALAALSDSRVKAAAGWAPVLYPDEVFLKIMGEENWRKLGNGESVHHEYAGVTFDANPCLRQDAEKISVVDVMERSGKPVLLRLGTADPVIDPAFGERITALNAKNITVQMVEEENHGFLVHEQENIDATIAFLRKSLER